MSTKLHLTAGSAAGGPYELDLTPERAGWTYSGPRVPVMLAGRVRRARGRVPELGAMATPA